MHRLIPWVASLLLALAVPVSRVAAQDDQTAENDVIARRAFEAGREAFAAGDYDTALQRFREAYELSHRSELLYNIAQSLDRLRRDQETLETLRRYLEEVPNSRSRSEVEARISVLERMLERERTEEEQRRQAEELARLERERLERLRQEQERRHREEAQQTASSRPPLHPAFALTAAGLALAGGGVAVWSGLETLSLHDRYTAAASAPFEERKQLYDDGTLYQTITNVLIFSSAALAGTAIVMLVFTDWGGEPATESAPAATTWLPTLSIDPNGAMVGAVGRF